MTGDLFRRSDTAVFSPDERHRYELTREFGGTRPLVICGLNPSTATAIKDDRTIAREIGFAKRWGCGRLVKVNAYGYRTKHPKIMFAAKRDGVDIVGRGLIAKGPGTRASPTAIEFDMGNDYYVHANAELAVEHDGIFVVAWGANIERDRELEIVEFLERTRARVMCFGVNKDGSPAHPLYKPGDTELVRWEPRAA